MQVPVDDDVSIEGVGYSTEPQALRTISEAVPDSQS